MCKQKLKKMKKTIELHEYEVVTLLSVLESEINNLRNALNNNINPSFNDALLKDIMELEGLLLNIKG